MSGRNLLLDTHAIVWSFGGEPLSAEASEAIDTTWAQGWTVFISPISAWEVGMLVRKGRLRLPQAPYRWLESVLATRGVELADLPPDVLIDANFLPDCRLTDPADEMLVATARALNLTMITRDRSILAYAEAGHVQAIAC